MQTWKLEIEYEGTRYRGWQQQKNARSVQAELIAAAENALEMPVEIGGAGRTDAGVHALRQIAHLRVRDPLPPALTPRRLQFLINDHLPHDINLRRVANALPSFHARHDANMRYYLYQISTRRTAFGKQYVWWVKDRLDVRAMAEAATLFVGAHDFRSFCESPTQQESTRVHVETSQITQADDLILFRLGASHFLWKMVRRIVGTLVEIGRGSIGKADVQRMLRQLSRENAAWTAPPSGLFLEQVCYAGDAPPATLTPIFPVH